MVLFSIYCVGCDSFKHGTSDFPGAIASLVDIRDDSKCQFDLLVHKN